MSARRSRDGGGRGRRPGDAPAGGLAGPRKAGGARRSRAAPASPRKGRGGDEPTSPSDDAPIARRSPGASGARRRRGRGAWSARSGAVAGGLALLGTVLVALLGLLVWGGVGKAGGARVVLDWPAGTSPAEGAALLAREGVTTRPLLLSLYFRAFAGVEDFVPGEHVLATDLAPRELAQRLRRSALRPAVRVTVPEGWNHLQLAARLEEQGVCTAGAFRAAVRDPELLRRLGLPGESAEGHLFPATYELPVDSEAAVVVQQLAAEHDKRLGRILGENAPAWERFQREHGLSRQELVVLASIVEREARHADERGRIASVYLNRLKDPAFRPLRMLQADPTAAYGCALEPERAPSCAGFTGKVTPAMVRDPENRWNTYKRPGLPPGPIGNPGEATLLATLTAPTTDLLFFVHTGDGRHTFSRTFQEHRDAARGE